MITTKFPFKVTKLGSDPTPKLPNEFKEYDQLLEG